MLLLERGATSAGGIATLPTHARRRCQPVGGHLEREAVTGAMTALAHRNRLFQKRRDPQRIDRAAGQRPPAGPTKSVGVPAKPDRPAPWCSNCRFRSRSSSSATTAASHRATSRLPVGRPTSEDGAQGRPAKAGPIRARSSQRALSLASICPAEDFSGGRPASWSLTYHARRRPPLSVRAPQPGERGRLMPLPRRTPRHRITILGQDASGAVRR